MACIIDGRVEHSSARTERLMKFNSTTIVPPWPSPPYTLACPAGTPQATCDLLGPTDPSCFEPEWDTAEIITAILLGHPGALYVDTGCNIGAFALQAYSLGAHVRQFRSVELATTATRERRVAFPQSPFTPRNDRSTATNPRDTTSMQSGTACRPSPRRAP
eukprot:946140-Prymnesium_polylepis.1